jgi:hypothetical protein
MPAVGLTQMLHKNIHEVRGLGAPSAAWRVLARPGKNQFGGFACNGAGGALHGIVQGREFC